MMLCVALPPFVFLGVFEHDKEVPCLLFYKNLRCFVQKNIRFDVYLRIQKPNFLCWGEVSIHALNKALLLFSAFISGL